MQLVETGGEFHAVGGVKYWLGTGRRRFGLRGQAGFSWSPAGSISGRVADAADRLGESCLLF